MFITRHFKPVDVFLESNNAGFLQALFIFKLSLLNLPERKLILMAKKSNIKINVVGNVEGSLRQYKKKIEREGVVRDMKRQVYFEPPTQKRRKRLMRAVKQNYVRMISQHLI